MSNQVGDCFKFLWPFQNFRTLTSNHQFIFTNPWIFFKEILCYSFSSWKITCVFKTCASAKPFAKVVPMANYIVDIHKSFSSTQYYSPTYLFWNTRQKSKNESQESATESEEIQPAKNRSFRRSKVSKNQDSDDNTISSNEKKIVRKSPPQIIVHKSQPSEHKQGTLYH